VNRASLPTTANRYERCCETVELTLGQLAGEQYCNAPWSVHYRARRFPPCAGSLSRVWSHQPLVVAFVSKPKGLMRCDKPAHGTFAIYCALTLPYLSHLEEKTFFVRFCVREQDRRISASVTSWRCGHVDFLLQT
jgi:hypothetical protein